VPSRASYATTPNSQFAGGYDFLSQTNGFTKTPSGGYVNSDVYQAETAYNPVQTNAFKVGLKTHLLDDKVLAGVYGFYNDIQGMQGIATDLLIRAG